MSDLAYVRVPLRSAHAVAAPFRPRHAVTDSDGTEPSLAEDSGDATQDGADDPYAQGYDAGRRDALRDFSAEREKWMQLLASFEALQPEPSEELALLIGETVEQLVRTIISNAEIDKDWLQEQALAAANLVRDTDMARVIKLHPEDAALLCGAPLPLSVESSPECARGSVRIDCSKGWIEGGLPLYLDALRSELGLAES